MQRTLGMTVSGGGLHKLTSKKMLDDLWRLIVHDLFLGIWKPLAVMRPAYILRVVGLEEQSRFLATMGLAERWDASRLGGAWADRVPGRSMSVVVERNGRSAEEIAAAYSYTHRKLLHHHRAGGAGVRRARHGHDPRRPLRPGGHPDAEVRADSSHRLRRVAVLEDGADRRERHHGPARGREVGTHPHRQPDVLQRMAARHPVPVRPGPGGGATLEAVRRGLSEDDAVIWVTDRLMAPEYKDVLTRLMGGKKFSRARVELEARIGQDSVTNLTANRTPRSRSRR